MSRVNRFKVRNSLTNKILIIILFLIAGIVLFGTAYFILNKSVSDLAYNIGEYSSEYKDYIIKDYSEYLKLTKKYNISNDLNESNFEDNYYLVSFQEYSPCSESRFKEVESVTIDQNITVTLKIHNKCGFCRTNSALHLIKIDKVEGKEITYKYNYNKDLNCGTIK